MTLVIECRYNLMIALRHNIDSSLKEQITLLHDYKAYGVKYFLIKKFLPHISQQRLKLIQIFEGIICLSTKIFCLSSYFGACCSSVFQKLEIFWGSFHFDFLSYKWSVAKNLAHQKFKTTAAEKKQSPPDHSSTGRASQQSVHFKILFKKMFTKLRQKNGLTNISADWWMHLILRQGKSIVIWQKFSVKFQ